MILLMRGVPLTTSGALMVQYIHINFMYMYIQPSEVFI